MDESKKILVIGANGFVGENLIKSLKDQNDVTGVYHKNKDSLCNDICNFPISKLNLLPTEFDHVYLVGAYIPGHDIDSSTRESLFKANVCLVEQVCSKFQDSRIIFCSSVSVYKARPNPITEVDNEGGLNEYGISKLWGEKIVQRVKSCSIVRISSIYGIGMNLETIIPNYIMQALNERTITVFGNGTRLQNYIHYSDVIGFLKKAAVSKINGVFLATDKQSFSNLHLAQIIAGVTGSNIVFKGEDTSHSFIYDNRYTASNLDYIPKTSLEKGVKHLTEWLKKRY